LTPAGGCVRLDSDVGQQDRTQGEPVRSPVVKASLKCPECRARLTIPEEFSGRSIVCPLCSTPLKVQGSDDAYRVVPDERLHKPPTVKVVIKNNPPPAKQGPSWLAQHLLQLILGVVGGVVVAVLVAFLGLSQGDKREPIGEKRTHGQVAESGEGSSKNAEGPKTENPLPPKRMPQPVETRAATLKRLRTEAIAARAEAEVHMSKTGLPEADQARFREYVSHGQDTKILSSANPQLRKVLESDLVKKWVKAETTYLRAANPPQVRKVRPDGGKSPDG
jgi:hypothetical protein